MRSQPITFVGTSLALSNTVAAKLLSSQESQLPPSSMYLESIELVFDSIAGGATTCNWYLTAGNDKDKKITQPVASTIETTDATAGEGIVKYTFDRFKTSSTTSVPFDTDEVYLQADLDVGTANVLASVSGDIV